MADGQLAPDTTEPPAMRRTFAPRLWPSLIAFVMLGVLVSLGNWQKSRYAENVDARSHYHKQFDVKPALRDLASIAGDGANVARLTELQYRRAELSGTLEPEHSQLLTARYMLGRRGYGVMIPLRVASGPHARVLVHLGWVPAERIAAYLRSVAEAPHRTITGRLQIASPGADVQPSGELLGHPTWMRAHVDAIAKLVPNMEPRLMVQAGEMANGKAINIDRVPIDGYVHPVRMEPGKHVEYAVTWFGLAVTLVFVWIAFSLRKVPIVVRKA